jgi:HAD superfamily hydrolase (TIGR01450 family)
VNRAPRGLIIDMDGVLYRGELPMPGLRDFFSLIGQRPFVLVTNNSTVSAVDCAQKLGRMGVEVPTEAVLTVADATSRYLAGMEPPISRALVLGSPALKAAVGLAGLVLVPEGSGADVVVIGLDRRFSYASLSHAVRLVGEGAAFVATSLDCVLLTEGGVVPGAGALVAAVRACVDVAPVCVGKPSPAMFEMATSQLGVPAAEALVIGDNLASDIAGGAAAGASTALLLSGVTAAESHTAIGPGSAGDGEVGADGASAVRPDFVFAGLPELSAFLRQSWGGAVT